MAGEVLVTLGVVVFCFLAYVLWGTTAREAAAQHGFASQLGRQWSRSPGRGAGAGVPGGRVRLVAGRPFALMTIPRFGPGWRFAVVQGTGLAQLALGPGHVPGTGLPGRAGNFAVAGHRVTAGSPFWKLPQLRGGDAIVVATGEVIYRYRVTGRPRWVSPQDLAVLEPVPGRPGAMPRQQLITLITCDPPWTGTHRVIVTGRLAGTAPRRQRGRAGPGS